MLLFDSPSLIALNRELRLSMRKLLQELEQIYGELDDASVGPQGGGEGATA